ncbi:hypothetical protein, partial [Klebsiella oxytoca]|uniref:hypothetical protein n=1 Tax=Klebsiella oxytoca TaxID=571 RepID=UPI001C9D6837
GIDSQQLLTEVLVEIVGHHNRLLNSSSASCQKRTPLIIGLPLLSSTMTFVICLLIFGRLL